MSPRWAVNWLMVAMPALALGLQDGAAREARELVERLGSESFDEREEAVRRLRVIGRPARWP